ncbi:MAG TPA: cell division protein FtsA [Candidatus Absconditabacterales bacterium]|nr:cell division protein FtsA [Candidatus Absconditabacterales bacterium]HNG96913.1 cell division protein FtsA [Candidatus Absconditabacterales bacterium]
MQKIKTVFDLGNGYIKGVVFGLEETKTTILVKDLVKTKGVRKGKVLDPTALTESMAEVIKNFNNKLGGDFIDDIYLGISHPEMVVTRFSENMRVMGEKVTHDDVNHLMKVVAEIADKPNYETLKINPVVWIIDDEIKTNDPLGMVGRKIELVVDVLYIPKYFYQSIIELANSLQLNIVDIIPNMLGASELVLDYDSRDLGTLLVDIGSNQTSYVVYENGAPLIYGVLPIGGEDVTKDISIGMQIDMKEAEHLKVDFTMSNVGQEAQSNDQLDTKFLEEIISARYLELFEKINDTLTQYNIDGRLPGGVMLMGGGARMKGVDLLAKETFKLATHFAKNNQLHVGELGNHLQFLNTMGLYLYSEKYSDHANKFKLTIGFGWVKDLWKFFKEVF